MVNLNERIRQLQEEEKQRIANQQARVILKQQVEQLKLQKDAELRNAARKQEDERKLKLFGILDNLQVRQKLEEVKRQVWQSQGVISEEQPDLTRYGGSTSRVIRLGIDVKTRIPELETKIYSVAVNEGERGTIYDTRFSTRVYKWHDVLKPSYLGVGMDIEKSSTTLYVTDTEVDLLSGKVGSHNLRGKAESLGVSLDSTYRSVSYMERSGKQFNRKTHDSQSYSYSLDKSFQVGEVELKIKNPEVSTGLMGEFLEHFLALSYVLRQAQGKLPLQLK